MVNGGEGGIRTLDRFETMQIKVLQINKLNWLVQIKYIIFLVKLRHFVAENVKDMQLPVELTDLLGDLDARILQTQIKLSGTIGMDEWHKYQFAVFV